MVYFTLFHLEPTNLISFDQYRSQVMLIDELLNDGYDFVLAAQLQVIRQNVIFYNTVK